MGFAATNTAEAALGAWAFIKISDGALDFTRIKDLAGLVFVVIFVNALTALMGAAVTATAFNAPFWDAWMLWWIADGLGMMLVTPFLLSWSHIRTIVRQTRFLRWLELSAILVVIISLSVSVFGIIPQEFQFLERPYLAMAAIVWMAIRFECWGVALGLLVTTIISFFSVISGLGDAPWGAVSHPRELLMQTQGYLITLIGIALSISTAITEGKHTKDALHVSEQKFAKIFYCAPLLITLSRLEDGRCLDVNDTFVKLSGFSREEAVGKTLPELGWISASNRQRLIRNHQNPGSCL